MLSDLLLFFLIKLFNDIELFKFKTINLSFLTLSDSENQSS